jgi:hypothetical protein
MGPLRDIHHSSGSEGCLNLVKDWAQICDQEHQDSNCKPSTGTKHPRRVIDVGPINQPTSNVRLYQPLGENDK